MNELDVKELRYIVVSIILVVIAFVLGMEKLLTLPGFVYSAICMGVLSTAIGYIISGIVMWKKHKDNSLIIVPLTCIVIAGLSFIAGMISYETDTGLMRGIEAQLIWFCISAPAFIASLIHFLVFLFKRDKYKKEQAAAASLSKEHEDDFAEKTVGADETKSGKNNGNEKERKL